MLKSLMVFAGGALLMLISLMNQLHGGALIGITMMFIAYAWALTSEAINREARMRDEFTGLLLEMAEHVERLKK